MTGKSFGENKVQRVPYCQGLNFKSFWPLSVEASKEPLSDAVINTERQLYFRKHLPSPVPATFTEAFADNLFIPIPCQQDI